MAESSVDIVIPAHETEYDTGMGVCYDVHGPVTVTWSGGGSPVFIMKPDDWPINAGGIEHIICLSLAQARQLADALRLCGLPMNVESNGPTTARPTPTREQLMDMIEDRDERIAHLRSALYSIAMMTKERDHDLFSATQVAAAAIGLK